MSVTLRRSSRLAAQVSTQSGHPLIMARGPAPLPQAKASFRFRSLPPELRQQIWSHCLPASPTVHFFDVCASGSKTNTSDLRVRLTIEYDSGYRIVYTLLAVCKEARSVVEKRYKNSQWDFRSFNWIPSCDLIVLCFPPRHRKLSHTITLRFDRPGRNLGVMLMDRREDARLGLIARILGKLSGIESAFIVRPPLKPLCYDYLESSIARFWLPSGLMKSIDLVNAKNYKKRQRHLLRIFRNELQGIENKDFLSFRSGRPSPREVYW